MIRGLRKDSAKTMCLNKWRNRSTAEWGAPGADGDALLGTPAGADLEADGDGLHELQAASRGSLAASAMRAVVDSFQRAHEVATASAEQRATKLDRRKEQEGLALAAMVRVVQSGVSARDRRAAGGADPAPAPPRASPFSSWDRPVTATVARRQFAALCEPGEPDADAALASQHADVGMELAGGGTAGPQVVLPARALDVGARGASLLLPADAPVWAAPTQAATELNAEQFRIGHHLWTWLANERLAASGGTAAPPLRLLCLGAGGTGKSRVIGALYDHSPPGSVVMAASTGVAAGSLGRNCRTLHALALLSVGKKPGGTGPRNLARGMSDRARTKLRSFFPEAAKLLIIDEVSERPVSLCVTAPPSPPFSSA